LRHQSSIAVLQSAGVLSSNHSDSRITEFLSSTAALEDDDEEENRSRGNGRGSGRGSGYDPFKIISRAQSSATGAGTTTQLPIDPLVTSMLVSVPSRTPSSSSIISGVTAMTDPNPSTEESNTVPLSTANANPSAKDKDTKKPSLISNFAIFGSSSNSNPVAAEADENQDHCGELGSLYGGGGGGGGDDRPVRKPFFSNPKASSSASPQNSNAIAHRLTFSHENPISVATASAESSAAGGGGGAGAGGQRLSHGKSSFTKSSSQDSSSSASINATSAAGASVGAENASRFMRRRSVTNLLEGRPSGLTSPPIEGQGQAPMSPTTATGMAEESDDVSVMSTASAVSSVLESRPSAVRDKLRRRGSASAALAQQTAQFRKKVSDQSQGPATGGSTSIAEE
jgi:hypothetical protein